MCFCSTWETADSRSTTSLRNSSFGVGDVADSTSIIFLQPTPATKAASSASSLSPSWNAASSPANGSGRAIGRLVIVGLIFSSAKSAFVGSSPAVLAAPRSQSTPPYPVFAASRILSSPLTLGVSEPFRDTNMPFVPDCALNADSARGAMASAAPAAAARLMKSRRFKTTLISSPRHRPRPWALGLGLWALGVCGSGRAGSPAEGPQPKAQGPKPEPHRQNWNRICTCALRNASCRCAVIAARRTGRSSRARCVSARRRSPPWERDTRSSGCCPGSRCP